MLGSVGLKGVRSDSKIVMRRPSFSCLSSIFLAAPLLSPRNTTAAFAPATLFPPGKTSAYPSFTAATTTGAGCSPNNNSKFAGLVGTVRSFHHRTTVLMAERKAGVASPEELKAFVEAAGDSLLVIDVRNPDASVEPGDQKSLAVAALPSDSNRPRARHLIWDRATNSMPLPDVAKDTPIITHCGGGGRGQKAMDFLMKNGFTKVLNGGGPKETECWNVFGDK